jgi:hypothetical protein
VVQLLLPGMRRIEGEGLSRQWKESRRLSQEHGQAIFRLLGYKEQLSAVWGLFGRQQQRRQGRGGQKHM